MLSVGFFSLFMFACGQVLTFDGDFNHIAHRLAGLFFMVASIFNLFKGFIVLKNTK